MRSAKACGTSTVRRRSCEGCPPGAGCTAALQEYGRSTPEATQKIARSSARPRLRPVGSNRLSQPRIGPGEAEAIFAFIPPSAVEIIDTWYVTGLRATGTQDLRVDAVFVPEHMVGHATMGAHRAGFAQVPPVVLGLARRAIEEFTQLAQTKQSAFGRPRLAEQVQAQTGVARAEALVRAARTYWYNELETLWYEAVQIGRAHV